MPISIDSIKKIGSKAWEFTVSGVGPFDWWDVDNAERLLESSTETSLVVHNDDSEEPPVIEVLDLNSEASSDASALRWPATVTLQWRRQLNTKYYKVEQWSGSAWVRAGEIPENGYGYYQWESGAQADVSLAQFRVIAVQEIVETRTLVRTYESRPLPFDFDIRRNPPVPKVSRSYAGGNLTIAARA